MRMVNPFLPGQEHTVLAVLSFGQIQRLTADDDADVRLYRVRQVAERLAELNAEPTLVAAVRGELISVLRALGQNSPAAVVDAAIREARTAAELSSGSNDSDLVPPDCMPWPERVDGGAILGQIARHLQRYLTLPTGAAPAIAAWIVATWCSDHLRIAPILALLSATKQSGKTVTLELVSVLARRAITATSLTGAVLFRLVHQVRPTLLWDEAEILSGRSSGAGGDLITIMNASHRRGTGVIRCNPDDYELRRFDTFGFRAVAAIGTLAPTLVDRSIVVPMVRGRTRIDGTSLVLIGQDGEPKERFDPEAFTNETLRLKREIARWAQDQGPSVGRRTKHAPRPYWLDQRGSDNWAPLFAIGELCGDRYLEWLLSASRALTEARCDRDVDPREILIRDLHSIFASRGNPALVPTDELLQALAGLEDRPWGRFSGGRPITAKALSELLRDFQVRPRQHRTSSEKTVRGYTFESLEAVFDSYVPQGDVGHAEHPGHEEQAVTARGGSAIDVDIATGSVSTSGSQSGGNSGADTCVTDVPDVPRVQKGLPAARSAA